MNIRTWYDTLSPRTISRLAGLLAGVLFIGALYLFTISPPQDFPEQDTIVVVSEGDTLATISEKLVSRSIIRTRAAFEFFVIAAGSERNVVAGPYAFSEPLPVWQVAARMTRGQYHVRPIRVLLHEGITRQQMAAVLEQQLPLFSREKFLELTDEHEGYLFPDTYSFFPDADARMVADTLLDTFTHKFIDTHEQAIAAAPLSLHEIVTLASIVEREARGAEDARMIAGILLGRLSDGMRLQVDASLYYLLGKTSAELTRKDLAIDSPYNTYVYEGLPPSPISNPGIEALEAVLNPKDTIYRYYLHDASGEPHYARTHKQHVANKRQYLR